VEIALMISARVAEIIFLVPKLASIAAFCRIDRGVGPMNRGCIGHVIVVFDAIGIALTAYIRPDRRENTSGAVKASV
jgi:hypothetical protein